jgi:hypothetical protein
MSIEIVVFREMQARAKEPKGRVFAVHFQQRKGRNVSRIPRKGWRQRLGTCKKMRCLIHDGAGSSAKSFTSGGVSGWRTVRVLLRYYSMLSGILENRFPMGNADFGKTWTAEAIASVASLRPDAPTINFRSTSIRNARSHAPIFSIGCSRSGTTLLYHMLLSSGNFAVYRAESFIFTLFEPRFRPLSEPRNKRRMLDAWYKTRLFTRTGLEPSDVDARMMAECQNGGDFLRIFMEEMCRKQGVERWAETTPEHLLSVREIKRTIPNARIIHVIRDGRDVALSWERLSQIRRLPGDRNRAAMAAAIYWEWIVEKGRDAGRALGPDYVEVRYEDLVRRPAEVLRSLEPFVEHDLDYQRIAEVGIGSVSAPNTAFKDENRSPVGRWKTDFPEEELETLEGLIGEGLKQLGYGLGTKRSRRPGLAAMRAAYRLYFDTKLYVKHRTPIGKLLVTHELHAP